MEPRSPAPQSLGSNYANLKGHLDESQQTTESSRDPQTTARSLSLVAQDSEEGEKEGENAPWSTSSHLPPLQARLSQMGQQTVRKSRSSESDRTVSTASGGTPNGHTLGDMDSRLEMRRKHSHLETDDSASQTAHLMSRESFTLDDDPPTMPHSQNSNASFWELPRQDRRNFLLLVLLYFLQGIPMGLAGGSVPFLLKKNLSYSQLGVFSLSSYPYSLKLLWSPIVDAVWHPYFGRRKSWILPIQTCSGLGMIYLGANINKMMVAAESSDGSGVWTFTWWWFFLVFLCATQDIAVDGK